VARYWLFWDGDCGFCRWSVAWVEARDRQRLFRAVPYQTAPRPPMTDELAARCARAVHVLGADGTLLAGGRASLFVLEHIGWARLGRALRRRPWVWLVEAGYRVVAANRGWLGRLLPRGPARCGISSPRGR
jgi:predicted DCC family thiol-disulfide oxidoreductase YuxK